MSGTPIDFEYIREEALSGNMGQKLMAIVAEGSRGRVYLSPSVEQEQITGTAKPEIKLDLKIVPGMSERVVGYGMTTYGDLYSSRQLMALATFSDLVGEVRERVRLDAVEAGLPADDMPLDAGGTGVRAYADAISLYLAFVNSKVADRNTTLTRWMHQRDSMHSTFSKQALPMNWDYVEVNALGEQTGGLAESLRWTLEAIEGTRVQLVGLRLKATLRSSNRMHHHSFPPTRLIMTTLVMPTYRIFSMSGCGGRYGQCSRTF